MQFILMAMATYERNESITFASISVAITLNCFESLPRGCKQITMKAVLICARSPTGKEISSSQVLVVFQRRML
jgi:hypothetical protein